jgi:L-fucose mutarotase/ribose pyranase (RbsD/FucU family)
MPNLQIIGLSGKANTGKDYIATNYLPEYKPFSFAWHFKVWLIGKGMATYDEVFLTKPPNVRKMLQLEGTEYGRDVYGTDIWCNTAATWMKVLAESGHGNKFVIPDVRFPNEVEFIQSLGGHVIRINAPTRANNNSLNEEARAHVSETALDDYDEFDGWLQNDPEDESFVADDLKNIIEYL